VSLTNSRGINALTLASVSGSEAIVRMLIVHGADVNALSRGRYTALMHAACEVSGAWRDVVCISFA
jgi:ankyrin repeat protein